MKIKNLQTNKNIKKLTTAIAVVSSTIIVGSIIFTNEKAKHTFQQPPINADNYTSISQELEEKYNINLEKDDLPCSLEIVDFIQKGNEYQENNSIENRIQYVNSAKALAYAANNMIKEKIHLATNEDPKDIILPQQDKTDGNYFTTVQINNQAYQLPDEMMDLIIASNKVTEYIGNGESEAWDDAINEFSNHSNKLFQEVLKSNYSLKLDNQNLSVIQNDTDTKRK